VARRGDEDPAVTHGLDQAGGDVPRVASNLQAASCESEPTRQMSWTSGDAFAGPLGLSEEALVRLEAGVRAQWEQQLVRPV
jgi:hypothetical protein